MPSLPFAIIEVLVGAVVGAFLTALWYSRYQKQQQDEVVRQATQLENQRLAIDHLRDELDKEKTRVEGLADEKYRLATKHAEMLARSETEKKYQEQQLKLLLENKEQLKQDFAALANDIFEQKQQRFADQSKHSITALLDPFNKQIEQFRKRIDDIHSKDTENSAQLGAQLAMLRDMNVQLNKQAEDLTKALKGDKKVQGTWGELQIERILESCGLRRDHEYKREPNFKDDVGNNFRPDFIVYLPDGKHIIIDSKVSLTAFQQVVTASDDLQREIALKNHIAATREHIRNLSAKNYPALQGVNAPDFVLMFMPVESAFVAAFEADNQLFNEAFERHIVVVTPTTLLASLRTVANLWMLQRQNENAQELYSLAGKIYDKVAVFSHKMDKLGEQMKTADQTYQSAVTSLTSGRGSMLSYVERLKKIGAPTSKTIADSLTPKETSLPAADE